MAKFISQLFVTNYSNLSRMDCAIPTYGQGADSVTIFRVNLNFARYTGYNSSNMPASPLGVYKPLIMLIVKSARCWQFK